MTTAKGYAEGLVVVRRQVEYPRTGKRSKAPAWTEHVEDCVYITRYASAGKAMPAPAEQWPNTFECTTCKPRSPHRVVERSHDEKTGIYFHKCLCGDVAEGHSSEVARQRSRRNHLRMARESAA